MKKSIFFLLVISLFVLCCKLQKHPTDINNAVSSLAKNVDLERKEVFAFTQPPSYTLKTRTLTGSGSGVGVTAWDTFYKTLSVQNLAKSLGRKGHTYYSSLKGWNTFHTIESNQINLIKSNLSATQPANSELIAWEILYANVPTLVLRTLLRFSSHQSFAKAKKFQIYEKSETAYIEKIKFLLSR